MTDFSTTGPRARRFRNALLAGVFTLGIAGAGGVTTLLSDSDIARAQPVESPAPAATPADFTAVVETVRPAVVAVQVETEVEAVANRSFRGMPEGFDDLPENHPFNEFFRRFGMPDGDQFGQRPEPFSPRRGQSQGSGFFISQDGYLVTNAHVVEDANEVSVLMDDGSELDAEVIGVDERTDLALLKVEGDDFTFVEFAKEEPKVGQWVIAVGNPFGLGGTVTAGIVSADGRDIGAGPYDDFIQIDAPVNRGNSGGPTFNTKGEVIGVNTAIFSPSGGNVGIAFAIPAATVEEIIADLKDDGSVTRGWLGVQIQPVTADIAESLGIEETDGAIVADVQPDSPAAESGFEAGDVITEVNGEAVKDPKTLSQTIARFEPGQAVMITVLRDGETQEFEVELGDLSDLDESQQANAGSEDRDERVQPGSLDGLGITVEPNEGGEGVVVTGVADDSPAGENGIRAGDVIVSVGGAPVDSVEDVEKGVNDAEGKGRGAVLFKVQGEQGTRFVGVPFQRG
jgi:serine protease Do